MGRRGPPKKPTALKIVENTYRKDRAPKNEPQPELGTPGPPDYLGPDARDAWGYYAPILENVRVLTRADWAQFTLLCETWGEIRELTRIIEEEGRVQESASGYLQNRPEVGQLNRQKELWIKLCQRFGLDPASRANIEAQPDGETGNGFAKLGRKSG